MKNIEKRFLLGVNNIENKIYIGGFNLTYINNCFRFTGSFYDGKAFNVEDVLNDLWNATDEETRNYFSRNGEITKQKIFNNILGYSKYKAIKFCTGTNFETKLKNGKVINFESNYCNQYDIRENKKEFENIIFTDKKATLLLLELWDKFHSKNVNNNLKEIETKTNEIIQRIDEYSTQKPENIKNFIKEHMLIN